MSKKKRIFVEHVAGEFGPCPLCGKWHQLIHLQPKRGKPRHKLKVIPSPQSEAIDKAKGL